MKLFPFQSPSIPLPPLPPPHSFPPLLCWSAIIFHFIPPIHSLLSYFFPSPIYQAFLPTHLTLSISSPFPTPTFFISSFLILPYALMLNKMASQLCVKINHAFSAICALNAHNISFISFPCVFEKYIAHVSSIDNSLKNMNISSLMIVSLVF